MTYEYSKCGMSGEDSSQLLVPAELEYTFPGLEEDTEYVFNLTALGSGGTETMTPISVRTLTAGYTIAMSIPEIHYTVSYIQQTILSTTALPCTQSPESNGH